MHKSFPGRSQLCRRQLFGGLGVAVTVPWLECMTDRRAVAAGNPESVPNRMLIAHFGTGMNLHEFFPDAEGPDCRFKRILKPLDSFRDRMTVLSGMQLEHGGGHTGDYTFLTGTTGWSSSGITGGISADQVVAKEIGSATRFPSMQFSIERGTNFGNQGLATLSWSENGIPLAAENDPYVLFSRMFESDDPGAAKSRDAAFVRRGSILDLVRDQAKQLERGVGVEDKRKLDEYFTSVAEIENQLRRDIDWSKKPKPRPDLADIGDYSVSLTPQSDDFDYERYQKLMYDLVVLAFKTDSTRVITYNIRQELRGGVFPAHGVSKGFHSLTHHGNDPKNLDELARVDEVNMGWFAGLLRRLDSVEQVDGRSLLDHTTVAFSSSAGMDHSRDRLPTVVFGGEALGWKHKTHLKLPEKTPLANLWHTMASSMGVQRETLQDSTGVITDLV